MIINAAPQNEAILSNVGQIGEFRIRNSAKAFNILSSGLYANKIRAIIRELSCNAVDSHMAAGKKETPFDVHLPNAIEPWFAIRDYGVGLSNAQVTNIYTTYFESTKTDSNDYIGALGLGSKSPFSYTDNFTVTAIKDGKRGIYTAFINEHGVPSIALMMEEDTHEPSGVEVKFSVNERYDFGKFQQEAVEVYTHFKLRPVVSGAHGFRFTDLKYIDKDIVPGVHSYGKDGYHRNSKAIMGNIAYPIDIPNADQNLGDLHQLLNCGLELHFDIGEIDFQASREGLSYIPQTIASIKAKLEALNTQLAIHLTAEVNKITNLWERAVFLFNKKEEPLWAASVHKYIRDTSFPLIVIDNNYVRMKVFSLSEKELKAKYNISLTGFERTRGYNSICRNLRADPVHVRRADGTGYDVVDSEWKVTTSLSEFFVENDTKIGATERAKFHWRNATITPNSYCEHVYVMSKADKSKAMDVAAFLASLQDMPAKQFMLASTLNEKPKNIKSMGKNVTILRLEEKTTGWGRKTGETVWKDAGKADAFDAKLTYYYVPLSGFTFTSAVASGFKDVSAFLRSMEYCDIAGLKNIRIYGVRKTDIDFIKSQKNWSNLEEHIAATLKKLDSKFMCSLARLEVDRHSFLKYNNVLGQVDKNSPFAVLLNKFNNVTKGNTGLENLKTLTSRYAPDVTDKAAKVVKEFADECGAVRNRYPLLDGLQSSGVPMAALVEYINLIDAKKVI